MGIERKSHELPKTKETPVVKQAPREVPEVLQRLHEVERMLRTADYTADREKRKELHKKAVEKGVDVVTSGDQKPIKRSLDVLAQEDPEFHRRVNDSLIKSCMLDYEKQQAKFIKK